MKREIVQEGDPVLRLKAKPVAKKDIGSKKISSLISDMKLALAKEDFGVAIAAPQLGASVRIFIIAGKAFISNEEKKAFETDEAEKVPPDMVFINPVLKRLSRGAAEMSEGCLSIRGKYGTVLRHAKATVDAQGEDGKAFTYHGSGLIGHIFQHECDHLEGVLYIDKAIKLEEDQDLKSARKKLKEKHNV